VQFQLSDWERIHRKMVLYVDGLLMQHDNPEQLDLIVGQLRHDLRDSDVEIVRLSPGAVFLDDSEIPKLDRLLDRERGIKIDYLGEVPPCLEFSDPLVVHVDPLLADIVTLAELERIGVEDEEARARRERVWELDELKLRERWPDNTLVHLLSFLQPRCEGGVPPDQVLTLRSLLHESIEARRTGPVIVLEFDDADSTELFASMPMASDIIRARFGDCALAIDVDDEEIALELMDQVGIASTAS
jgi:hypothetical protein